MLRSLEIQNYRNLRHLTIEKLGRVNLLVGKNNTGKTSVLEAVYLWANYGRFDKIYECLETRDGFFESISEDRYLRGQALLSSLFTNRLKNGSDGSIVINSKQELESTVLTIKLNHVKVTIPVTEQESFQPELLRLSVSSSNDPIDRVIMAEQFLRLKEPNFPNYGFPSDLTNQFIRANNESSLSVGTLFDQVATTDLEEEVVNTLKIIDSRISKIAFRTDTLSNKRYPIIRLKGSNDPIPLRSMGDGINRILTIILAMVNCEGGYLLIDEFENGLHYSVQEKLWEIIFYLAERLNIQVFATTHSNDTIRSFTSILPKQEKPDEIGKAIRLQLHNDIIRAVDYSPEELETAAEYNIEVR